MCSALQASSLALIAPSASDQPASRRPEPREHTTCSSRQPVAHIPRHALRLYSRCSTAPLLHFVLIPSRPLRPPCRARSPFRELSQIAAPPASLSSRSHSQSTYTLVCVTCQPHSIITHPSTTAFLANICSNSIAFHIAPHHGAKCTLETVSVQQ